MSEQGTADLAERAQLDKDLTACLKPKAVQLVNNLTPIQPDASSKWIGRCTSDSENLARNPDTYVLRV